MVKFMVRMNQTHDSEIGSSQYSDLRLKIRCGGSREIGDEGPQHVVT